MTSIFKDCIRHFYLPWKCHHKVPDYRWLLTGSTFFAGGCFLGAAGLIFGASWTFALLYFLLGTLGCIICCLCGFTIFSIQNTENSPLVSSKSKKLESKTLLSNFSSIDCNSSNFDTKEKDKNSESNDSSLKLDEFCGYDYLSIRVNIDKKKQEKVICLDFNPNRSPGVRHEQYATGPAPRVRSNQTTKDDRQPQARGTLNFVRKMFRLPSFFKRKNSNPTPQREIPLRELRRSISEDGTFSGVQQSESVSAEEAEGVRIHIRQSTSEDFLQRTYENLLPSKGLVPKSPQDRVSISGIRQDNTSNIQSSFDVFSPYQNIPPREQMGIDRSPSKHVISSTHAEKEAPFPPEKLYENLRITRGPPRTYRHYENLSLIRPGLYDTVHPGGPYVNTPTACHKSRQSMQVPHTSSSSAYQGPPEKDRRSMKTDRKPLLSAAAAIEKNMTSAVELANKTEDIGKIRNPSKDSFHELGVSGPYVNIPSSRGKMTKNQQFQEASENSEALESAKESTLICDTSTRLQPVRPSHTQKKNEVEERLLTEKLYERSNISPLQGVCKTENDKISQSDERESTPLASERTCFNNPPLQDRKNQCMQIPEATSEGQDTKKWKSKNPSRLLEHEVSPRKLNKREDMALKPSEKDPETEDNNIKTLTEHSNVLYSERHVDNSVKTRSDTSRINTDKSPTLERRLLSFSAKSPSRIPERHSRVTVSETKPQNQECSPKEKFLSEATGFSNQSYSRISELERKHSDMAHIYPNLQNKTEKPETELHRDTESKDSSGFTKEHRDSKTEAENKLRRGRTNTSTSRSDYLYVPSTGPPQKDFIRPSVDIQSSQSAKYKLSPSNLDPLDSREPLSGRKTNLLASEQHNANDQNLRKFSSRDEANIPSENNTKQMLVTAPNTAEEICPEQLVSVLQSIRPDMCNPLPLKLPQGNQSVSEDYSDDATDSPESKRATWEGRPERTRSEYQCVTQTGSSVRSYVSLRSSSHQRTESLENNPMDLKRAYDNPIYGKTLRSLEKIMLETERVLERGPRTKVEDTDIPTSQGSVFCIVGSPKSPTQSQSSVTAEAIESQSSATAEAIESQSSATAEAIESQSSATAEAIESQSSATAEAIESQSSATAEAIESQSSATAEAIESQSSATAEAIESQSSATAEAIESQSSATAEAIESQSSATAEAIESQSSATAEAIESQSSATAEAIESQSSATAQAIESQSSATAQAIESQSSATAQAIESQSSATAQAIESQSSATAQAIESQSSATAQAIESQSSATAQAIESEASAAAQATESGTQALGRDDPVQLEKSSECKDINVTFYTVKRIEGSAMEQGVRKPDSCLTQFDTDSNRIKLEGIPQREEMQDISSGQKIRDPLSSSISRDSHGLSGRTDGFQKKEHASLPSPSKSARYLTLRSKDSDDFQTVKAADDVFCHSEDTSQKILHFEPECDRIRTPVPRYASDVHQNEPREASAVSSGSTDQSLDKSSRALSETMSSQSTESRPSAYYSPLPSPSKVKTQIQVRGGHSTPQQRFAEPPEKIILPVIGSPILSPSHPLTQGKSASGQQLRLLSPFKNLHSPGFASRGMSHPESGANVEDKLPDRSATITADPTSYTSPPPASRTSTRFPFPSPEKSLESTRRPFSTKSASKEQSKFVRVSLPETPLTLLRSSENPPERSHPSDERK